jgi:hypothetical protein
MFTTSQNQLDFKTVAGPFNSLTTFVRKDDVAPQP